MSSWLLLIILSLWSQTRATVLPMPFKARKALLLNRPVSAPSIRGTAIKLFRDIGWSFEVHKNSPDQNKTVIKSRFEGTNGTYLVYADLDDAEQRVRVYCYSSVCQSVPEKVRSRMAEYLTRANYGIIIGNFEMDYGGGEVRFKASMDLKGGKLEPSMFRNLVSLSVDTMDFYHVGLMEVVVSDKLPSEIIGEVERGEVSERNALLGAQSGGDSPS